MPTYEYRCSNGHHFELFQRMNEEPARTCPECGAPAERQLSAGAGILFKGSGFYTTDYRSESYRKAAEAESGKTADASGKAADSASGKAAKEGGGKAGDGGAASKPATGKDG